MSDSNPIVDFKPFPLPRNPKFQDLTGLTFDRLTVTGYAGKVDGHNRFWYCHCACGNTATVRGGHLKSGRSASCGCQRVEKQMKHGASRNGKKTAEYRTWAMLVSRCTNPNDPAYSDYGGRGIQVCENWRHSFPSFLDCVGLKPSLQHSIDRINNDGNYEPGNVRWATKKEQQRNRRVTLTCTYQDITATVTQHCERLNLPYSVVQSRLKNGWAVGDAFTRPIQRHTKQSRNQSL